MAKSKSFFGLRRGSTKSQTYSVLRGEQITKDRVTGVANPKTSAQMRQRVLFASVVKFYKHANQRFFKFAFEDRKQAESDYNAFVRHNVKRGVIQNFEVYKDEFQPALGQNWQLTQGSLSSPQWGTRRSTVELSVTGVTEESTWPQVVAAIIAQYGLQIGDFITFVAVQSFVQLVGPAPQFAPKWIIKQVVLDPEAVPAEFGTNLIVDADSLAFEMGIDNDYACGCSLIFSRNIAGSSVKVSTSYLENNDVAQEMVNNLLDEDVINGNLTTWGATGKAILQGALVQE